MNRARQLETAENLRRLAQAADASGERLAAAFHRLAALNLEAVVIAEDLGSSLSATRSSPTN